MHGAYENDIICGHEKKNITSGHKNIIKITKKKYILLRIILKHKTNNELKYK